MCVFLARYCFLRILARFGTRSIRYLEDFDRRILENSPRAVQSNDAFWSMRTGNCVLSAGTRLTNDDDHLHRSPLFIHMNETLNLLTVQLLLFCYSRSSIGPHEILYRESVLLAPTIALIICHSRHFPSLLAVQCNSVMNYSRNDIRSVLFFSFPTCCFPNSKRFSSIDLRPVARNNIVFQWWNGNNSKKD